MSNPENPLPTEEPNDETMEDFAFKRGQQSPGSAADPPKKPRLDWISEDAQTTTLLKSINYESISQMCYGSEDEEEEVNKDIRRMWEDRSALHKNKYWDSDIDKVRISGCYGGPTPISAGPVLEVISLSIYKKRNKHDSSDHPVWTDFGIYGQISLNDYHKNIYYVYNCPETDPEHVLENMPLCLTDNPMAPVMGSKVKFNLKDADTHVPIFKDDIDYYLDDSLECGQQLSQDFHGEGDYVARMVFKKTPLAVLIELEFLFGYKPSSYPAGSTFKIHGTFKANDIICWQSVPEGDDVFYATNSTFTQSKSVFAVPIKTSTVVDMFWRSIDMEFKEILKVEPGYFFGPTTRHHFTCKNNDYGFELDIDTASHHDFFHIMCGLSLDMKRNPDTRQIYSQLKDRASQVSLVEVFSVLLCSVDSSVAPPPLWGQIVVRDQQRKFYIFARNQDRPDKYSSSEQRFKRTLSLAWPDDWVLDKDFYMQLRLKDDKDNRVCKGFLSWQNQDVRIDRRLCDVILGENGYYVAVHYSVFLNGKKAKVSVNCTSEVGDRFCLVYGSIYAEYDNYDDYHSTYDKECYRVVIFRRTDEDCVKVDRGSELPLSKSHISAPSDCESLYVHVDLCFRPLGKDRSYEPAIDKLVFKAGISEFRSCGKHVRVEIQWFS